MGKTRQLVGAIGVSVLLISAGIAGAQVPQSERDRAAEMAQQISTLMVDLEARAQEFPGVLEQLRQGQIEIDMADQTVADLIAQLTEVTNAMEDDTEFDNSIDAYKDSTVALIAEAEASPNAAIKATIPALRATLASLEADDASRQQTVIDARNVIADLKENREAIAFFIRAGQVQMAAELIAANVADFSGIVERGRAIADGLIQAANP